MNYTEIAKMYWANGFQVIPVNSDKNPAIPNWGKYLVADMSTEEIDKYFSNCWGIAMLMGGKQSLTALDFDLKYDRVGDIFERYKNNVAEKDKDLLKKMLVNTTKNHGYHFIYSCPERKGPNRKLASRYTTAEEQHKTYMEAYSERDTMDKAIKIAVSDKSRVLIETRGHGGYVLLPPSPGYTSFYGDQIYRITPEEHDILFECAMMVNEVTDPSTKLKTAKYDSWSLSPFNDYNERSDFKTMLESYGWVGIESDYSKDIRFLRPGKPTSKDSAVFDKNTRRFKVFSTSTLFDSLANYSPVDVLSMLEFDNDTTLTFNHLIEQGYGIKN